VHVAIQQGEIAARNAARLIRGSAEPLERMDYALKLFAVFTQPEVAAVGRTEWEAADDECDVLVSRYPFIDHGKSLVRGETDGFVKLIVERESRKILGASVIGPDASELIHEIAVAMHFRATAGDLARVPHYHPTLSEIWTYPAEELAG
jgi:pyruvate/2-oxoglutarate dehydrogenase complex dihydrolipoamide dehydrogenase (E3) component